MVAPVLGAVPPASAAPAVRTRCIPETWEDVLESHKAFITAATPVMAVAMGVLTAVLTALKCPKPRYGYAAPPDRRTMARRRRTR